MPVDAQSHADIGMTKNFLNDFRIDSHTQQDGGRAFTSNV
jgi:hypothetical protein